MTTAAEVKQYVAQYPADAQRLVFAPSGLLADADSHEQLARDVVALANRDGGRIILGVDTAGRYEEGLALSKDTAAEALPSLLDTWTAPRVDATLEHLVGEDGELLVIGVPRRTGSPHAVARTNAKGRVGARLYCVRDGDRTAPVTDGQLAWLFASTDPGSSGEDVEFTLHVGPTGLRHDVLQVRVADALEAMLSGVPDELLASIHDDAGRLQQATVELAAWVFLEELGEVLAEFGNIDSAEIALDELPVPGSGSVFAAMDGGLRGLLGGGSPRGVMNRLLRRRSATRSFVLPSGAEVQVDYLVRLGRGRLNVHAPGVRLGFTIEPGETGTGLRWPGIELPEAPEARWVALRARLEVDTPFPTDRAPTGGLADGLAQALRQRLRARWDDAALHESVSPAAVEQLLTQRDS